jgi:uncharacterized membrane protein YdjX (TVP38/TMEM64 family)/rhodanese-related sulfurtransferase
MTGSVLRRVLLGVPIAAAALGAVMMRDRMDVAGIESVVRALGVWGPVGHVVLFALGTVLFVPGSLFGLVGGLLFGPIVGTILNLTGATLGATAAFLVARYVASDWVRTRAGGRLDRLVTGVEAEGWRFVALVRLVPIIPFNLLNYALGLTRINLLGYVFASLVCMVPGTLAYTWLGHAGRSGLSGDDTAIRYAMIGLAVLIAVALLPGLIRRLRGEDQRWIEVHDLAARRRAARIAIIDVRGPDEFSGPLGHIEGAHNIPLAEMNGRLGELKSLAEQPVVLVCLTDRRSSKAATILAQAGFRDVLVLRGGMAHWNDVGLPVDQAKTGCEGR